MEELRADSLCHQTWGGPTSQRQSRQTTFTSTSVPKFTGVTSWEQYRQVFDAIVLSNGWDDATAALQLLSHLEGDALNVALLVPESKGRLADFRRQGGRGGPFHLCNHIGNPGSQAFGDIGQTSRLRIIRDHFIAGDSCCELRRHLDNVAPETPIRDIVDRCRVWESHADSDNRWVERPVPERALPIYTVNDANGGGVGRVATAVPAPPTGPGQLERLLR